MGLNCRIAGEKIFMAANSDNRERFSGKAGLYSAGRPSYAEGFLQELRSLYGFGGDTVVADIGSGTGKLTKQLLQLGCRVFGVEPNEDMRRAAEADLAGYPGFGSIKGDASHTTLPDRSVDAVTVAQAFHWFPVDEFRQECLRICRPGGRIFLIWNQRDMSSPLVQDLHRLYTRYGKDFTGFNQGLTEDDERIRRFFRADEPSGDRNPCYDRKEYPNPLTYDREEYPNPLTYDREGFRIRCLSSSHSPKSGEGNYEAYMREVDRIFDEYAEDGRLHMPNRTTVYSGEIGDGPLAPWAQGDRGPSPGSHRGPSPGSLGGGENG